jgi:hypothetical protein
MLERRRASRLLIRIPVNVFGHNAAGQTVQASAEAVAVSRVGGLVRAPLHPALGAILEIFNVLNNQAKEFRVIRVTRTAQDGLFELALEMLHPIGSFWGIPFPNDPPGLTPKFPETVL